MKKKWMYYAACGLALFGLAACSSNDLPMAVHLIKETAVR